MDIHTGEHVTKTTTTASYLTSKSCLCPLCDIFASMASVVDATVDHGVAMALAEARHHTAARRQTTARASATYNALRSQTTSVTGDTEFFSLYEEDLGGTRPDRLFEVRPQDRVQRRTVEQIVDNTLIVPSLDVPVPQLENQLLEVCLQLDTPKPEQVIEVPKISSFRHSHRRRVRFAEQTAEQLVEVSYSSFHGLVEQNVDIPVPLGRGGRVGVRGLQGFPGQDSRAFGEALYFPAATAEQIVDTPVPRGVRQDPDLPSAASSSGFLGTANQGFFFFARFPDRKKRAVGSALGVGTGYGHQLIHAGGSAGWFVHGCSWRVDAAP